MAAESRRRDKFRDSQNVFRTNSAIIIKNMLKMSIMTTEDTTVLVDEILHSIFFLGKINNPPFPPEDIVSDKEMLKALREAYPQPFELYSSQVPQRSPISCVLDMIVRLFGQEKEDRIIRTLQSLLSQLSRLPEVKHLISSTICVSQKTRDSVRHYGVSMSTCGRGPGQIMVAASCLRAWDSRVADAVMTYYPKRAGENYFDGTIQLPENIRCQAFNLSEGEEMPPCRACSNLFGLLSSEETPWPYGHCAEAESLSNFFENEPEVKQQVQPRSEMWTSEGRERAREDVLIRLRSLLKTMRFKWDNNFYTPQRVRALEN